jgi:hypothetical protein
MQLRTGEITKQSQTTGCSIFPRCYISSCSDGTGRQHTWCQKCTNGFVKRGALPHSYMTSASLLRNSEPDLGFFRPRLAPYGLRKPTPRSFDRVGQHAVGLRSTSSGAALLHMCAYNPLSLVAGAVRPIATSSFDILASVRIRERAGSPRPREAKS